MAEVTTIFPAEEYDVFTQGAADTFKGHDVTVEDEDGKRVVGKVVMAKAVDGGRAIEITVDIRDKAALHGLRI